jgi:predicted O-methyltransferase YrrM
MNAISLIEQIYESGEVTTADGLNIPMDSHISASEGKFLFDLISGDPSIRRSLEIGCANGLSSLHICAALDGRDAFHTIIDPFQSTDWRGAGITNLKRAGLKNYELLEEFSEFCMPRLTAGQTGKFDLIFIDGWHTFDHTLLDCFYATRLLRVGGYLVIDDTDMPSVSRVVRYIETYPCYERIGSVKEYTPDLRVRFAKAALFPPLNRIIPYLREGIQSALSEKNFLPSLVAFRKQSEDARPWHWYVDF